MKNSNIQLITKSNSYAVIDSGTSKCHWVLLGKWNVHRPALIPQLCKCDRITLLVVCEHQPENEQHDQQRVQHPPALLPLAVEVLGNLDDNADNALPQMYKWVGCIQGF